MLYFRYFFVISNFLCVIQSAIRMTFDTCLALFVRADGVLCKRVWRAHSMTTLLVVSYTNVKASEWIHIKRMPYTESRCVFNRLFYSFASRRTHFHSSDTFRVSFSSSARARIFPCCRRSQSIRTHFEKKERKMLKSDLLSKQRKTHKTKWNSAQMTRRLQHWNQRISMHSFT